MLVVVAASDNQWNELTCSGVKIDWLRVEDAAEFILHKNAYAFFSLKDNKILHEFESLNKQFLFSLLLTHSIAMSSLDPPDDDLPAQPQDICIPLQAIRGRGAATAMAHRFAHPSKEEQRHRHSQSICLRPTRR